MAPASAWSPGRGARRRRCRVWRRWSGPALAPIRTQFGRFARQGSGYALEHLLPERGGDLARALVGSEGTLAVVLGATVRLVRAPAATVLVVLGYPDMAAAADAVGTVLPLRPVALEGIDARIVEVVRRRGRAVPRAAQGRRLAAGRAGRRDPGRGRGGRRPADRRRRRRRAGRPGPARPGRDGRHLAHPRGRGRVSAGAARPGRRPGPAGRTRPSRPSGSAPTCASSRPCWPPTACDGIPYGHFGDGCLHVRIDFPFDRPGGQTVYRAFVEQAAALVATYGGSMSGEHGDGRARSELLPLMYPPDAIEAMAAVKAVLDPRDLLNPGVLVRPRPFDADLRRTMAAAGHRAARVPLCRGRGRPDQRRPPLHGDRALRRRRHRRRRGDVPVLAGDQGREGHHQGPEPRCSRRRSTAAWSAAWPRPRSASPSTSAWPARAASPTARPGSTWPPTRPRSSTRPTAAASARPPTTASAGCPAGPPLAARAPAPGQPPARHPGRCPPLAKRLGGIDPRRPLPTVRPPDPPRLVAPPPGGVGPAPVDPSPGAAVARHLHRPLRHPRSARPPSRSSRTPATGSTSPTSRSAAASPGSPPASSTPPNGSSAAPSTGSPPWCADGAGVHSPLVGLEPSCLAVLRHDALGLLGPDDPAAVARGAGGGDPGRGAGGHARVGAARPVRRGRGGPAALPPARRARLGGRPRPAGPGRAPRSRPSAAAAAWPATSAPSAATTTSRSPCAETGPPPGRAGRRPGRGRPGRRLLLPHPARPAGRPPGPPPGRAAGPAAER